MGIFTKYTFGPVSIAHIRLQGDHNNNKMERMNGEVRDREKHMRGFIYIIKGETEEDTLKNGAEHLFKFTV